ncbi:hypothetical protein BLNAU_24852 [Blattamonas nauphoetae]|nr:hypothetical protein BLNAU_24852 [Blattamonas nauphoetae]
MNERHSLVNLIKHLDCYPFCEFISSVLFTIDNVSLKSDLLTLIKSDNFVTNILKQLHCSTNPIESSSIYQILSHIIAIFSNVDLPEIVSQLFLQTDRDLIISILFEGASNHAKIAVLSLLIDIVWNLRYFSHDDAFDPIDEDVQPPEFIEAFILPNLTRFSTLLKGMTSPSVFSSVDCFNRKGMIKLRLIILFSSVIRSGYGHSVDSALISSQIFPTLVELFFSPSNNNILHTELYTIFEQGLISRSDDLCEHIVLDSGLATRVKDSLHKEQERLTQLLTQPSYSTSPLIATCSIDSNDPVPSPSPPLLSKTPIKVDDVPPYLAHTLHIARILQDKAVYVNGLLEILDAEWDELFSVIVKPQMDAQESPPLPITDEMAQQVSMNQTPIQLDWNNGSSDQYDDDFVM